MLVLVDPSFNFRESVVGKKCIAASEFLFFELEVWNLCFLNSFSLISLEQFSFSYVEMFYP